EVSFTKRAAAELSRCFNGLTVSRGGSSKKSSGNASSSSSSTASAIGSISKEKEANSGSRSQSLIEETTFLLSGLKSSKNASKDSASEIHSNGNYCAKVNQKQPTVTPCAPFKSETLITKTNTTITPFKSSSSNASNAKTGNGTGKQSAPGTPNRKAGPPPRAPPKTSRARRKNFLLSLQKPKSLDELWSDRSFLNKFFFYFTAKERCILSQVCPRWRDILYSNSYFWRGLMPVIYCNELRRYADDASNSVRQGLYASIEKRGFDSICLFGATDTDVIDFASKISPTVMRSCTFGSLRCSSVSDKGLEIFLATLNQSIKKLELSGCNEITDSGLWTSLVPHLESLTICDCINVADETMAAITQMLPSLNELILQAYHVTDVAMTYFGPAAARENLKTLCLQHCWELSNQGILNVAHGLPNLTHLSLSGCSKVTDDAIEVIAEQIRGLKKLDLSWCSRISDAALEYIACDLSDVLSELILDRSPHITDIGLGYIATMSQLTTLTLRWCPQIRDFGLQTLCSMKSLKVLSVAGCPQLSVNGLSCLVQMQQLTELELTNCPAATKELLKYLKDHLPNSCTIII
ncbi:F-box/LRR-repeat protein 16-like protein, partial [Dinothrombium tinctorium]